jgi:hypothetical protein
MRMTDLAHRAALLAAAVLLTAASPRTYVPLAAVESQPPPAADPRSTAFSAFAPAPVPDIDQQGVRQKPGPARMELTPSFYKPREGPSGDGFTPNSTIYGEQTKRLLPTPGLNLNVPLN